MKRLRWLIRVVARRTEFEERMREEMRFHVEEHARELARGGMDEKEAARRARVEFGGWNTAEGECRRARGLERLDEIGRQARQAVRTLRKAPGFTAAALATLGICIAANLTMFAAVESILIRALPFPEAGRLVTIFNTYPKAGVERDGSSIANYYERRGKIPAFESVSIYRLGTAIVGEAGGAGRVEAMQVSPEFFRTVGIGPAMGRAFTDGETSYAANGAVILSDGFRRERFPGDARAVGRTIQVNGAPATIVGVLPPGFRFLSSGARLYLPLASSAEQRSSRERHSGGNVTQMIARLRAGASVEQAQAQIDAQNEALEKDDPQRAMIAAAGFRSVVRPLHADHVASIRPMLLLLQAGAGALLLIGVVNLANLLLVRAQGRAKEMAVRRALGAGWRQMAMEAIGETMILAMGGGALGLAGAAGGVRLLAALGAERLPLGAQIGLDWRTALAALGGALAIAAVLAGPLVWMSGRALGAGALHSETRGGTASKGAQRLRQSFVVAQMGLALMLVAGAGLLGASLKRLMDVAPGFRPDHVLTARVLLPAAESGAAVASFRQRLAAELSGLPGVEYAGVASNVPLSGTSGKSAATVEGHEPRAGESPRGHYSYWVGGDYFGAMGFARRQGRFLNEDDAKRGARVCVVDEDFARYYWPEGGAVGQRLYEGSERGRPEEAFTVVGVVSAAKQAGMNEEAGQGAVYFPDVFRGDGDWFAVVRTSQRPEAIAGQMRRVVRGIDGEAVVTDVRTMEGRIADSLVSRRGPALAAGLFSAIAVLLTAIGIYGVVGYSVTQRRREIGVRMALGAEPRQIRNQFLAMTGKLLGIGAALGAMGAWAAGRAMENVLFHVRALDPAIVAGAAALVGVVSVAACAGPAYRASRISPVETLAQE